MPSGLLLTLISRLVLGGFTRFFYQKYRQKLKGFIQIIAWFVVAWYVLPNYVAIIIIMKGWGGRSPPTHFSLSLIINICLVNVHMISCIFQIMLPGFSWYNFITNALHLALRVPDDPNILGQFLTRVTGHQFVMADTNTNGDQVNSNPISSDSTSPSPGIKQSDQTVRSGVDVTDSNPIPSDSIPPGAHTERSKLDDDDHSYKSCASTHGDDDVLFDCAHTFRFPQGDQP